MGIEKFIPETIIAILFAGTGYVGRIYHSRLNRMEIKLNGKVDVKAFDETKNDLKAITETLGEHGELLARIDERSLHWAKKNGFE